MKNSTKAKTHETLSSSFRDPSGFIFTHKGTLYRQVNKSYSEEYQQLMESGLYEKLTSKKMLIPHAEVKSPVADKATAWKTIRPEPLEFISYPYEWCFSQLKDAALLTLDMQLAAPGYGMSLKDASAYNIQFHKGRPVMIDTLSFEKYSEGMPWTAYRQFCQHFLAPLVLMSKRDIRLNKLLLAYIDGIPLDLASGLLKRSTRFNPGLLMHIHLHAASQKKYSDAAAPEGVKRPATRRISRIGFIGIVQSLRKTVNSLDWNPSGTEWGDYYNATNYTDEAFNEKRGLVSRYLKAAKPAGVWDLGGNTGVFSRAAADLNIPVVSCDIDPAAVEINYRQVRENSEELVLPLLLDLTNPGPALGWNSDERDSFIQRGPVDCVMALALIHHLAISNNLPLEKIARFFQGICGHLIIEFIPKEDSQVQRLLSSRVDIFDNYDRKSFESVFSRYFDIRSSEPIVNSERTLYLMKRRGK